MGARSERGASACAVRRKAMADGAAPRKPAGCHRVLSGCHLGSHGKIGKNGFSSQFQGEERERGNSNIRLTSPQGYVEN